MVTRHPLGALRLPLALAVLAVAALAAACGEARAPASQDVTGCSTCHGYPPDKDAHLAHWTASTEGVAHARLDCLQCHLDVVHVNDPDHIVRADGTAVPPPAEVRFDDAGALASHTEPGATRPGPATFDKAAGTCSNVYCHGTGLKSAAPQATISWKDGTVSCGSCHGLPPADHPAGITVTQCTRCHGDAIDASGVPAAAKHVNGVVDLAPNVTTSCAACHGDPGSRTAAVLPGDPKSAPPTDAEGRDASDPAATSIGAHQAHLIGGTLGVAVACAECHQVPSSVLAEGHFDNQVTVAFGPLASKGGLTPAYDATSQTCSSVYCHGNFPHSVDAPPPPSPTWNGGAAAVQCGACHGLPPPAPAHPPIDVTSQGCNTSTIPALQCHPSPYSPTTVDPRLHIDGRICPPFCD